jgi:FixJ family two-component response regulator
MITSAMNRVEHSTTVESGAYSARIHVVDQDPAVFELIAEPAVASGLIPLSYETVDEFRTRFSSEALSCVVLDVSNPAANGMELLREIRQTSPEIPVIITSHRTDVSCVLESIRSGAVDFLEKPVQSNELFERILLALEGGRVERRKRNRRTELLDRIDRLTPREFEVMALLRQGKTVKEIAYEFGLSHKTVQVHRARVLKRMGVNSVVLLTNLLNEFGIDLGCDSVSRT